MPNVPSTQFSIQSASQEYSLCNGSVVVGVRTPISLSTLSNNNVTIACHEHTVDNMIMEASKYLSCNTQNNKTKGLYLIHIYGITVES